MRDITVITGNIGSGKSEVSKILREAGKIVVDADTIAKEWINNNLLLIQAVTKVSVTNQNGTLDKSQFAELMLQDSEFRKKLVSIVHPAVYLAIYDYYKFFKPVHPDGIFAEIPLFFESIDIARKYHDFKDVFIVDADLRIREHRCMKNRGYSSMEFERRNNLQMTTQQKRSIMPNANIIDNSASRNRLYKTVIRQVLGIF